MDAFDLRERLILDYSDYVTSFMAIRDDRIKARVTENLKQGWLWPDASIGLNPSFAPGGWIDDLVNDGLLHPDCSTIFRFGKGPDKPVGEPMRLHRHQVDAIRAAKADRNYVLTTGTGSGKSMSYIVPIVDHVLRVGSGGGIKAIVVYPMNALANSQAGELEKFLGPRGGHQPVRFERYTGQENEEQRAEIIRNPPDVILTNYVMLEYILTRVRDRKLVEAAEGLKFLVLDELHTYRGRQGADVALLIRRLRAATKSPNMQCVGTSATLSTEGNYSDQRNAVARMASLLFGTSVTGDDVIGETLQRATPEIDFTDPVTRQALSDRVAQGPTTTDNYAELLGDPLSSWMETNLGVQDVGGRLARVPPLPLEGTNGAADRLAQTTGADVGDARNVIKAQLMAGYAARHPDTNFPAFAFRLHQFISKGDTVYASAEPEVTRHITLTGQRFVPQHRDRVLLPLSFCRACGQEYYTVSRTAPTDDHAARLLPRDLGDLQGEAGQTPGFLYISTEAPWLSDAEAVIQRLPEDWLEDTGGGLKVKSNNRRLLPQPVRVKTTGELDDADGVAASWIPAPFRLCLGCGVAYAGSLRRDFTKLTTLGSEGRSTATTVLSLSAVRYLRRDNSLDREAQKLLSFTDNRQDASLQAGHFNDFVQVGLLRAALYQAVKEAGEDGLEHEQVAGRVFDALALPFGDYAVDPEVEFQAKRDTEKTLRDVLGYRLYLDLRRGWRVTSPNLEQCGLLAIDYLSLDEVCAAQSVWDDKHAALAGATAAERRTVAKAMLDYLRRELAIKVEYLDRDFQEKLVQRSSQRLSGQWAVDDLGDLEHATAVLPRSRKPNDYRGYSYLSKHSGFGQFLRRPNTFAGYSAKLTLDETADLISGLFDALRKAGLVEQVDEEADGTPVYRVPASAMVWKGGDGVPYHDAVRMPSASKVAAGANDFFVKLYTDLASDLVGVEAHEHTAQVPYDEREEREAAFRSGDLPVLYCSPTMELGVDIAQLNVVNMRNVPPTPANYAQRSGRAGRSGQPALVFTYCAAQSPHDQWYFRRPHLMVSGAVSTPRLDVANEDLVRSHVHAIWLSSTKVSLGSSLRDVLEIGEGVTDPPLQESIEAALRDGKARQRALATSQQVLADLRSELEAAPWWNESWLGDVLNAVPPSFNAATTRWRELYTAAMAQFELQNKVIADHSRSQADRNQARRLRREAETQLELLAADGSGSRVQSDFYSYRYFASEGFLPGYSFPRLPLSAFVPGRKGRSSDGEFVNRPRFLAISEFGPQSLIYHEGSRYRINRVILPVGETQGDSNDPVLTSALKRCEACGYLHPVTAQRSPDVCERCGAELAALLPNMFRLQNVSTRRQDRIISDEEERQRAGFELISGVRFAVRNGRRSARNADVRSGDETVAAISYGDTANLWRINLGWRRRKNKAQTGFVLDMERGYWQSNPDAEQATADDPMSPLTKRVIPFVEDNRNCLLLEPVSALSQDQMASLQSALKNAIQVTFQLEDDELAAEPLPHFDERRLLLFYESAEGGAGVLRRLVDEPNALAEVAKKAIELCHFDPDSGHDLGGPARGEPCEAACYECLMSYRNQLDHQLLDRKAILPVLQTLAGATVEATSQQVADLEAAADSELEKRWLDFLRERNLRLPDRSQVLFSDQGTRPDFVYDEASAVVYVDGPHHLYPDRAARDAAQAAAMRDAGWRVIRFAHTDDWSQVIESFKGVFGVMQ